MIFDVADDNFDTSLWEPLRDYLTATHVPGRPGSVTIHTGVAIAGIDRHQRQGFRLHDTTGATLDSDGVVVATDVGGLRDIVAHSPALGDPRWRAYRRTGRRPTVSRAPDLARPAGACRPARLRRDRRPEPGGQHQCREPIRAETHATPTEPGADGLPRTAVVEAIIADSARPGFRLAHHAVPLLRPLMSRAAARLWRDDLAYAERLCLLRNRTHATDGPEGPRYGLST